MATKQVSLRIGDLVPQIRSVVSQSDTYHTVSQFVRAAIWKLLRAEMKAISRREPKPKGLFD